MLPNILVIVACGLIPMILGMAWYNPALFGKAWLKEAGLTEEAMKANQKPLKFLFGFILNVLLAFGVFTLVTHEFSILGLVGGDPALLQPGTTGGDFLAEYGGSFSRFSHGAVHGIFNAFFIVAAFIGHQCLWSGKSFKYFLIDWVFWSICVIIMGGVIAQWGGNMVV